MVGTGFNERMLTDLKMKLEALPPLSQSIEGIPRDPQATWVEPSVGLEVKYSSLTKAGNYRAPVFVRLRTDLEPVTLTA